MLTTMNNWSQEERKKFFEQFGWVPGDEVKVKMDRKLEAGTGICPGCGYALDDHNRGLTACPIRTK